MTTVTPARLPMLAPTGVARLLSAPGSGLAEHYQQFGPLPHPEPAALIAALEQSGLTGRGGAGFPTGRKLVAIRQSGRSTVVIANGAEGEPLSRKDRTLLHTAPHLVLDGLALAADAVGARQHYLYVPAGCLDVAARAIGERVGADGGGAPILVESPAHFLAGQESAAVNAVAGRPAVPGDAVVRVSGVGRAPTLVCNVETLAHLALIARFGPQWFRGQGTAAEPGTRLVTVASHEMPQVVGDGVFEVGTGIGLAQLLPDRNSLRAVLVGGYHGAWVPAARLGELRLSQESLRPYGATPGAGVLVGLARHECGLVRTAEIATWLAAQSAGQCGPCLNGLPRMARVLGRLADGERAPGLAGEVARLAALVEGRGACHHPDGTARMVRSALYTFATDVTLHLSGRCEARRG